MTISKTCLKALGCKYANGQSRTKCDLARAWHDPEYYPPCTSLGALHELRDTARALGRDLARDIDRAIWGRRRRVRQRRRGA